MKTLIWLGFVFLLNLTMGIWILVLHTTPLLCVAGIAAIVMSALMALLFFAALRARRVRLTPVYHLTQAQRERFRDASHQCAKQRAADQLGGSPEDYEVRDP